MFIQNQVIDLGNHQDVITAEIDNADQMLFVVAYVRENGVDVILDKIKDKPTKLLCSFDMGITQLSGIKKLLENGVTVKVYKSNVGTFHPKIWLFGKKKQWKMLIGSANLTRAALIDNVEASVLVEEQSVTSNALIFFNYLWDGENSTSVSIKDINVLQDKVNERKAFKNKHKQAKEEHDIKKTEVLFEYVKNWMDIPKSANKDISSLWRGWYIIPDQGYVNNKKMQHLKSYLPFIDGCIQKSNKKYNQLLALFVKNSKFKKKKLKTKHHGLFVKQAKNYLIKFGWCYHPIKPTGKPDKKILCLTKLGEQINQCKNLECVKDLYTDYFHNYSFIGLNIVQFTERLLQQLNYLTLDEFNYFVTHAYNDDDFETIVDLVHIYRSLKNPNTFNEQCAAYFKKTKGQTASNVYSNYVKKIKHTISVIAWCKGFVLDDKFTLKFDNAN